MKKLTIIILLFIVSNSYAQKRYVYTLDTGRYIVVYNDSICISKFKVKDLVIFESPRNIFNTVYIKQIIFRKLSGKYNYVFEYECYNLDNSYFGLLIEKFIKKE